VKGLASVFPRFALSRPVTVSMMLLAVLVMGLLSWQRIPVQLMPGGYDFPYLWVWMPYRDSTPRETERQIVQPVEDAIETLPGVRRLEARAGRNFARFEIELDQDVDMDEAWSGLTERLERARMELPDDFDQYYIYKYNPSDQPIVWAAVTYPSEADDPAFIVETRLLRALERVPGVARAEFNGAHRARVYIDFNREAIERHGVSLYQVMQKLGSDNFTMPSGKVDEDGRVVLIRTIATFESDVQIAELPIGPGLVLSDIAEVIHARPASATIHRVNGDPAGSIDIYKASGANTLVVCERIHEELALLHADPDLKGYKVLPFFDQGKIIQESVDNLRDTALQGGVLAVLVLLFFLRRLRVTMLIAASIPLSLLMTVVIQYGVGESINLIAMMGMMLSVGMTVDNSVVVVESIYRHRELGLAPREAAIKGTSEVALAILAATLTTVVVFLPIILMSDDAGFSFFMGRLGLPVCYALGSSLLVALVFVPLSTLLTNEPAKPSRFIVWLTDRYATLLRVVLNQRSTSFAVAALLVASMFWPMQHLDKSDGSSDGLMDFVVNIEFPSSFSTRQIDEVLKRYEKRFEKKRKSWRIRALRVRRWGSSRRAYLMAFMEPRERGDISKEDIEKSVPDILATVEEPGVTAGLGWRSSGRSEKSLPLTLRGDDSDRLVELGDEIVRRLSEVPGILGVEADLEERGMEELRVEVDRARAARYGVSPDVLARTVSFAFRGSQLQPAQIDGREVPVQAGFRLEDRADVRSLQDFGIWSPVGGEVALGTVASLRFAKGHDTIRREDRKTSLGIKVTLEGEDMSNGYDLIRQGLSGLQLPRGYSWTPGRRWDELQEQDRARKFALLMSVAFVFLLMGMLFESFWTPLAVLFTVPFAFVGVYWMLYLTGTTFEMMAGIGLVVLVGIVVNNAIVLLDRVQQYRFDGMEREQALLLAGRDRLRPILMTAATTIVGLLPMALGSSGIVGTPYYPLGRAVIGGLLASTVLSLLLVPLFYTYLDDLRQALSAAVRPSAKKSIEIPRPEEV
jgi:hydrophobic/amphiphilic exporter-1 (mainly G- bacteria), HAE1 family